MGRQKRAKRFKNNLASAKDRLQKPPVALSVTMLGLMNARPCARPCLVELEEAAIPKRQRKVEHQGVAVGKAPTKQMPVLDKAPTAQVAVTKKAPTAQEAVTKKAPTAQEATLGKAPTAQEAVVGKAPTAKEA